MKRIHHSFAKITGMIVTVVGIALLILIIPLWTWLLIIGIVFILIGIHIFRSC